MMVTKVTDVLKLGHLFILFVCFKVGSKAQGLLIEVFLLHFSLVEMHLRHGNESRMKVIEFKTGD